jgi:hypothetical protein
MTSTASSSSSENAAEFEHFGMTVTNENQINKEIKSRLNLENACYHLFNSFSLFPA